METKDIEKYLKENWLKKSNVELAKDIQRGLTTLKNIASDCGNNKIQ